MYKKLKTIRDQVHVLIDVVLELNAENKLPELIARHISFQNYIVGLRLSEDEVSEYLADKNVVDYMEHYQRYCLGFEIYLEHLMSEALTNPKHSSEVIQLLRSYYSSVYEIMSKNEIALSNISEHSRVCMVGVGSMPLSMLFMRRFSMAQVVGIDKSKEALLSAGKFIDFVSKRSPERYNADALSSLAADGAEFDYDQFDAVVLSIHIENKDAVIKRILDTTADKNKLIILDRRVLGLCQYFYKNNSAKLVKNYLILVDTISSGVITTQALCFN